MAKLSIFSICVIMISARAESCVLPSSIRVFVPQMIPAEYVVSIVEVVECDSTSLQLTSKDPNFAIRNGAIVALNPVSVTSGGRTFSVCALDNSGPESEMEVHLIQTPLQRSSVPRKSKDVLTRVKRRWSPPPFNIAENEKPPFPKSIDKLASDSEATHSVYYTVSGPGVTENPVGLFSVDKFTGMLYMHKPVDREQFPQLKFTTKVFDRNTNAETDLPLEVTVIVDDENDNKPTFTDQLQFTVLEQSSAGTVVGKVNAVDIDDVKTLHSKIKYSLLSGLDLFQVNPETGVITTLVSTLDREVQDKHLVTVQIKDMLGANNGLSNTGTATITLGDINDNPPTFKEKSYTATVKENEKEKLVLRIPVEDKDLVNTPNWIAEFVITKGNENGNFRMETDPKINEGLLYVAKPLDHEKSPNVKLEIMARNKAELTGTAAKWASIPVDLTVTNEDEGPQFSAPTVRFIVKENTPNGTVIGSYTAVDPETKSSEGIKYYKISDPGSWITMDRNSGQLKVANTIDRESHFVRDGIYTIPVKAVDASSKTGTGTVLLQVDDVNDNVPELPTAELVLCEKEGELGSVLVVAEDKDKSPFSSPFTFNLGPEHDGKWVVNKFNETAATLEHIKQLPTGIHKVPLEVRDLQGFGKTQLVNVRICQCRNGVCLAKESSVSLGALALLAMLLPLALLLLLCVLLAFFCATKMEKIELDDMADSGGILLKSNTEAPGEEVDSNLIIVPTTATSAAVKGSAKESMLNTGWLGNRSSSTIGERTMGERTQENGFYKTSNFTDGYVGQYESGQFGSAQMGRGHYSGGNMAFDNKQLMHDAALHQAWQTNSLLLQQRLGYLGADEEGEYAEDILHSYGYEGAGSAAGSVGCCSDQGANDDLDFLNALGPKFKTLADVCTKT